MRNFAVLMGLTFSTPAVAKKVSCISGFRGWVIAEYKTPSQVEAEEEKAARLELREPMPTSSTGLMIFDTARLTLAGSTGEYVTIAFGSADKPDELDRRPASHFIPWANSAGMWRRVYAEKPPTLPFDVHFIDSLNGDRCDVRVEEDGTMTKLKLE